MAFNLKDKIKQRIDYHQTELAIWKERLRLIEEVEADLSVDDETSYVGKIFEPTANTVSKPDAQKKTKRTGLTARVEEIVLSHGKEFGIFAADVRGCLLNAGFQPTSRNFNTSVSNALENLCNKKNPRIECIRTAQGKTFKAIKPLNCVENFAEKSAQNDHLQQKGVL